MTTTDESNEPGHAQYTFAAQFRLIASTPEWQADPPEIERTCYRRAAPPGEPGWLFFRDHLWRGECNHPEHLARLAGDAFGLPVGDIEFRGLRTDKAYFAALKREIAADLAPFNADSTAEVLNKYLGSSIHVDSEN